MPWAHSRPRLGDREREALELAAACGACFRAELLARVLGEDIETVIERLQAVEDACGAVRSTGAVFRFDGQSLRDVVYDDVPAPLRHEYHLLLAKAREAELLGDARTASDVEGHDAVFLVEQFLRTDEPTLAEPYLRCALDHVAQNARAWAFRRLADLAVARLGQSAEECVGEVERMRRTAAGGGGPTDRRPESLAR